MPSPNLTAKTWAPVSYSSVVQNLAAGQTRPFPQMTLQSGFNTPYLVDEIRFMVGYSGNSGPPAAVTSFQLSAGRHQFSSGAPNQTLYVPMCLFAPTYSGANVGLSISAAASQEDVVASIAIDTRETYSTRRWVLPKPLFMEAGDTIQASVSRDSTYLSNLSASTYNAWITIIGRALPPQTKAPPTRYIPYVSYFLHPNPTTTAYSEATSQILRNNNPVPWNVQRLVLTTRAGDANSVTLGNGFYENTSPSNYATIRIVDSLGYKVTGSPAGGFVPLGDVAAWCNNTAWTFSRTLPPEQYYAVAFNLVRGANTPAGLQPMISFVGYREEQW